MKGNTKRSKIQDPPANDNKHGLIVKDLSSYSMESVEWLWKDYIARGMQTIVHGYPEAGKGVVVASIAAAISAGGKFPNGEKAPQGRVIWFSAEDSVTHTLKARLIAAKADEDRIVMVEAVQPDLVAGYPTKTRSFDLKRDLSKLEKVIADYGDVLAVIFDPITAYMPNVNFSQKDQVRDVLDPVTAFAERTGAAVISIAHDVKGTGYARAAARISGSSAWWEIPRSAFTVQHTDPDDMDSERRLICTKMNLPGGRPPSLGFTTEPVYLDKIKTVRADWYDEPLSIGAEEAMAEAEEDTGKSRKLDMAKEFLGVLLTGGPVAVVQIQNEAKAAGLSWATVRRAKDEMPIEVRKDGTQGGWYWQLRGSGDQPKTLN